jgi:uncharacterized protein YodC (DUF2158 family)
MSEIFAVGDIVRLNSAITKMTVDRIDERGDDGKIKCIWFAADGDLKEATFHEQQLVLVQKARLSSSRSTS